MVSFESTDAPSSSTSGAVRAWGSLCLMSSHSRSPREVFTNVQEPRSLRPRSVKESLPAASPSCMRRSDVSRSPKERTPSSSGEYTPVSQTIICPAP